MTPTGVALAFVVALLANVLVWAWESRTGWHDEGPKS